MVRQVDALRIGNELLELHGLKAKGWQLQFNKSSKRLGQCWYQSKVIAISIYLLNSREEDEYRDTLLHEIAHALVGYLHSHDLVWQQKALEIGCNGMVCGEMNVDAAKGVTPAEQTEKKHISPLSKKCPICGEVAIETSRATFGAKTFSKLECGHLVSSDQIAESDFSTWESTTKGYKLFPYQVEGAKFIEKANGRCLIADEPGLGKTVQAISFLHHHAEVAYPCIWVCKGTLSIQALKENFEWTGNVPYLITSSKSFIMPNQKIYIISMDLLRRMKIEKMEEIGAKTLVFDEVQHIKNPDSARTNEVRRIANGVDFIIFLSGTPWKNRGSEYFSCLNMLAPEKFPSYHHFQNRWVDWYEDKKTGKWKQGGIKDIPAFKHYVKDIVIRRMREDVQPDLPKINRQIRYVEPEDIYGEAYEKAEKEVAAILKDIMLEGREGRSGAQIQSEIMKLKHITGLAKVDAQAEDAIEFLSETEDWQKLTIFHHHIDVGDNLQRKLDDWLLSEGYGRSLRLLGGIDVMTRNQIQEKFKNDERCRVLIASTLASGEGLNLQFCQNASMMERQWNAANEEQAELRFSRPLNWNDTPAYLQPHLFDGNGEPRKVSIRVPYLICSGTVDEILTDIVERKRHNYRKVMNDKDINLEWSENEMMQELMNAILRKRYKTFSERKVG